MIQLPSLPRLHIGAITVLVAGLLLPQLVHPQTPLSSVAKTVQGDRFSPQPSTRISPAPKAFRRAASGSPSCS